MGTARLRGATARAMGEGAPASSTVPQARHSRHCPTHFGEDQPHSEHL